MWNAIHPEVQGALIGVMALGVGWLVLRAIHYIRMYIDLKLLKNGKNSNGCTQVRHCADHYKFVKDIAEVKTDVKWIRHEVSNGRGLVHGTDMRD